MLCSKCSHLNSESDRICSTCAVTLRETRPATGIHGQGMFTGSLMRTCEAGEDADSLIGHLIEDRYPIKPSIGEGSMGTI
jgi:hypothetical protein